MANEIGTPQQTQTQTQSQSQSPEKRTPEAEVVDERRHMDVLPPVDIHEDENGITLKADLPGVASDSLEVNVDDDVISIEGEVHVNLPSDLRARIAEMRGTRYARRFTLSNELDAERIEADIRDGVLTLKIPKKESLKPRRITINTA